MFDTHCHLNDKVFKENLENVVLKARGSGINYILVPGIDVESSRVALEIARRFPYVFASCGIHPTCLDGDIDQALVFFTNIISENKLVAIGEIGLDYFHATDRQKQKEYLLKQINFAQENSLPVILHNRDSTADLLMLLNSIWDVKSKSTAVLHCCEPNSKLLKFALSNNIFIGVDGDVTFDKTKQNFIKSVPLDNLVLETDSPYLTPLPVKRIASFPNKPQNLIHIAEVVAKLIGETVEKTVSETTKNGLRLFNLNSSV